jgi:hypothetical protein
MPQEKPQPQTIRDPETGKLVESAEEFTTKESKGDLLIAPTDQGGRSDANS